MKHMSALGFSISNVSSWPDPVIVLLTIIVLHLASERGGGSSGAALALRSNEQYDLCTSSGEQEVLEDHILHQLGAKSEGFDQALNSTEMASHLLMNKPRENESPPEWFRLLKNEVSGKIKKREPRFVSPDYKDELVKFAEKHPAFFGDAYRSFVGKDFYFFPDIQAQAFEFAKACSKAYEQFLLEFEGLKGKVIRKDKRTGNLRMSEFTRVVQKYPEFFSDDFAKFVGQEFDANNMGASSLNFADACRKKNQECLQEFGVLKDRVLGKTKGQEKRSTFEFFCTLAETDTEFFKEAFVDFVGEVFDSSSIREAYLRFEEACSKAQFEEDFEGLKGRAIQYDNGEDEEFLLEGFGGFPEKYPELFSKAFVNFVGDSFESLEPQAAFEKFVKACLKANGEFLNLFEDLVHKVIGNTTGQKENEASLGGLAERYPEFFKEAFVNFVGEVFDSSSIATAYLRFEAACSRAQFEEDFEDLKGHVIRGEVEGGLPAFTEFEEKHRKFFSDKFDKFVEQPFDRSEMSATFVKFVIACQKEFGDFLIEFKDLKGRVSGETKGQEEHEAYFRRLAERSPAYLLKACSDFVGEDLRTLSIEAAFRKFEEACSKT